MGGAREYLDQNPAVSWVLTGCLLAAAFYVIFNFFRGPGTGGKPAFFFDLNTQTLVIHRSVDISPHPGSPSTFPYPDGEAGAQVRANVFACKGHQIQLEAGMSLEQIEAAGARLVSLQRTPTPELGHVQKIKDGEIGGSDAVDASRRLVSGPAAERWFGAESPQSFKLLGVLDELCGKTPPRPVSP